MPPLNTQLRLDVLGKAIKIPSFGDDALPYMDPYCYNTLFSCLDASNIALLLNYMCLEERILFISEHKGVLTACTEALCQLLFPFCWQHIYIPLLPKRLRMYLQAPVPILMGVDSNLLVTEDCAEAMRTAVVVNLDNNTVITPVD